MQSNKKQVYGREIWISLEFTIVMKPPQFINYGVDGTPNGLVYAGRGESCQKMIRENRESKTVNHFVSFGGDIAMCRIIFKGKGISAHMAPKEAVMQVPNLLISTNDSGSQDHCTLLSACQMFDRYLEKNNIKRPVVVLSDGHSSRLDSDVLTFSRFCQSRKTKPKRSKIMKKGNPSNNNKLRHSINVKKNVHVARMFVQ